MATSQFLDQRRKTSNGHWDGFTDRLLGHIANNIIPCILRLEWTQQNSRNRSGELGSGRPTNSTYLHPSTGFPRVGISRVQEVATRTRRIRGRPHDRVGSRMCGEPEEVAYTTSHPLVPNTTSHIVTTVNYRRIAGFKSFFATHVKYHHTRNNLPAHQQNNRHARTRVHK